MTSKYVELKPVEQLQFRSVSHGDLIFRKSIIKHLLKSLGYDKKNLWKKQTEWVLKIKQPQKQILLTL